MAQRIEYIDLAKGICIILVVLMHTTSHFPDYKQPLSDMLTVFRMPLYFVLSGLFFKQYESFIGFVKRKINKLLIPFIFFYITTSVLLPNILALVGYEVRNSDILGWYSLFNVFTHDTFSNSPIWFLLCLFWINVLFYQISNLVDSFFKGSVWVILGISFVLGVVGYLLGIYNINIPLYIDTSLTALPFFVCGYLLRKYTSILVPNNWDKYLLLMSLAMFILTYFLAAPAGFQINDYAYITIYQLYLGGLCGTLGVLFIAKLLKKLPLVSYWGRYSIIILCTHQLVLQFYILIMKKCGFVDTLPLLVIVYVLLGLVMVSYIVLIPFFVKFMPHVTAQKDVIPVK